MKPIMRTLVAILAAAALAAGCAWSKRGADDYFYVVTEPPGAHIATSAGASCVSPCTLILPRREGFDVEVALEGYETWRGRVSSVQRGGAETAALAAGDVVGGAALGGTTAVYATAAVGGGEAILSTAATTAATAGLAAGAAAPLAIDLSTGANRNLSPNPLVLRLTPKAGAERAAETRTDVEPEAS